MSDDELDLSNPLLVRFLDDFAELIRNDGRIVWAYARHPEKPYTASDVTICLSCTNKSVMESVSEDCGELLASVRRVVHAQRHVGFILEEGLHVELSLIDASHCRRRMNGYPLKETPGCFDHEAYPPSPPRRGDFLELVGQFWCWLANVPREIRRQGRLTGYMTVCPIVHSARLAALAARDDLGEDFEEEITRAISIPELTETALARQLVALAETFDRVASAACEKHDLEYPRELADVVMARLRRESEPFLR